MSEGKTIIKDGDSSWTLWLVLFVGYLLFGRGCSSEASYFDEYLKATSGRVVEGVVYEKLVGESPEAAKDERTE